MELHQLRYFVAVAESGGFSKAARRCYVSQPSLSQQIIKLEQELGQRLFERLGRSVVLTEAGRALLPRARLVLTETGNIKSGIVEDVDSGIGVLSAGFIPTIAPYLLPGTLKRFYAGYPHAGISLQENLTDRLIGGIIDLEIEVAVMSLPIENSPITTETLFDDPLYLALSPGHELVKAREIRAKDLKNIPFIALEEDHCLGEQINNFCYERQLNPDVVCRTWNLSTIQHCVSFGNGISLVPLMMVLTDTSNTCVYRPIKGRSPKRTVVAAWHRDRRPSKLAREFISMVKAEYASL
ncbi:MAG: LysR family transcriptional regulator, partial [Candidatus Dadabacteria bacterium]|nr:LysR family transcriptional regulator [Candidatus Dadabacteria bacterium]